MGGYDEIRDTNLLAEISRMMREHGKKPKDVRCVLGNPTIQRKKMSTRMSWGDFVDFAAGIRITIYNDERLWDERVPKLIRNCVGTLKVLGNGWWIGIENSFVGPSWSYHTYPVEPKETVDLANYLRYLLQATKRDSYDPKRHYAPLVAD